MTHDQLRALADKAKYGPPRLLIDDIDKAFIAAASPDVVLALLDTIEAQKASIREAWKAQHHALDVGYKRLEEIEQLRDQLTAMTTARNELAEIAMRAICDVGVLPMTDSRRVEELQTVGK